MKTFMSSQKGAHQQDMKPYAIRLSEDAAAPRRA